MSRPIKSHWLHASSEHEVFDIVEVPTPTQDGYELLNIFRQDDLVVSWFYRVLFLPLEVTTLILKWSKSTVSLRVGFFGQSVVFTVGHRVLWWNTDAIAQFLTELGEREIV